MKAHLEIAFESSIVEHLAENGWQIGTASHYDQHVGLDPVELFAFIGATQPKEWAKLESMHGSPELARTKFMQRVVKELDSRGTISVLRKGVTDLSVTIRLAFFAPAHDLTPELRELYDANRVTVTRQVAHSESNPGDEVDLLLSLNGLPIATAELKAQTAGQNVEHAIYQYRHDRNPKDLIFRARTVVHFAVDQDTVYMTTRLSGPGTVFLPFNQGSNGPGVDGGRGNPLNPNGVRTEYLWEQVWQRDAWLDILGSFVHFENLRDKAGKPTGQSLTVFPRYHQWDAVGRLLTAARAHGPGNNKLIQHSAGSGKSNTIAWLAHRLSTLHTPANPGQLTAAVKSAGLGANEPVFHKVVVVTDRRVLDRQLRDTVASFDHVPGSIVKIDQNSAQLREALRGTNGRIIITTLQKFPIVAELGAELSGTRFAVVVDEAHSSQSGEAVKDLKAVLSGQTGAAALTAAEKADGETEAGNSDSQDQLADLLDKSVAARGKQANLSFFAFTATPKHRTLMLFGEKPAEPSQSDQPNRPFHLYSMRQAIEEGFILDVLANYTTYKTYYRLANGLGGEDPDLPKGKAASALARWVSLHPTNIGQRAEVIVEHFRAHTATKIGGHAKAMVVTSSRLHAVRYYLAIKAYIEKKGYHKGQHALHALVAFSGTVVDPDLPEVEYREGLLNGFSETMLPERFGTDDYQVLVVAEKYQTGFDQPLLHTMYVAKKLGDVKAVQTLSRLNRITPGKEDTFVLDFENDAEDIVEAFAPFFAETTAAPTDPNILFNLKQRIDEVAILVPAEVDAGVLAILQGGHAGTAKLNAAIDPAVERWHALETDDEREDFRTAIRDFVRAYAFLAQIVPFSDAELEKLYYYAKYLIQKLPRDESGGAVDLDGAVVLTHLRTELKAADQDLSLDAGSEDPLTGPGEGRGKQVLEPTAPLSELIDALNERFGMELGEADQIFFEQLSTHVGRDKDIKVVALNNDIEQFGVYLEPKIQDLIIDRQESNEELLKAFFDKPEFRSLIVSWMTENLYKKINDDDKRAG